jgi:UDP-N-acetylglucosamine--dolichyl-phosphate N-acetylglucosaminephosphotransferase
MGALITFVILIIGVLLPIDYAGKTETIILMAAMFGALLAFLHFNWFPAKIFGGDSLTLMIGASIAAVAIVGNLEKIALLLFALYFIELLIKAKHRFKSECYGIPQKDGSLKPDPKGGSLTQWVMRRGSFTEPQVVSIILGIQILVSLFVLFLFWFKLFNLVG